MIAFRCCVSYRFRPGATPGCTELWMRRSKKPLLSMDGNVLAIKCSRSSSSGQVLCFFCSFAFKDVSIQKTVASEELKRYYISYIL
jgi:hypothetical protein